MKYFYLTALVIILNLSCVPKIKFDKVQEENKKLEKELRIKESRDRDFEGLEFKLRNIMFDLDLCQNKIKRQDRKLLECVNMLEDCRKK